MPPSSHLFLDYFASLSLSSLPHLSVCLTSLLSSFVSIPTGACQLEFPWHELWCQWQEGSLQNGVRRKARLPPTVSALTEKPVYFTGEWQDITNRSLPNTATSCPLFHAAFVSCTSSSVSFPSNSEGIPLFPVDLCISLPRGRDRFIGRGVGGVRERSVSVTTWITFKERLKQAWMLGVSHFGYLEESNHSSNPSNTPCLDAPTLSFT